MPGACQLSGNVVPAVGKSEGATPRRMECIAITRRKMSPTSVSGGWGK